MRILDARYSRDVRRHYLALRMIRHEARTLTIRTWTGLSETRIRGLFRSYLAQGVAASVRHRGPAPSRLDPLLRSKRLASEAAGLAGLCFALGVLPERPMPNADRDLPGLSAGERLCYAFELFHQIAPKSAITFDLLIPLVMGLARRVEIALGHCDHCDAAILIALLETRARVCAQCESEQRSGAGLEVSVQMGVPSGDRTEGDPSAQPPSGYQEPLF